DAVQLDTVRPQQPAARSRHEPCLRCRSARQTSVPRAPYAAVPRTVKRGNGGSRQWAVGSREGAGDDRTDSAATGTAPSPTAYCPLPTASTLRVLLSAVMCGHSLCEHYVVECIR